MKFENYSIKKVLTFAGVLCMFLVSFQGNTQTIDATLYLDLDCYGQHTSWVLKDWGGNTLQSASVGTYSENLPAGDSQYAIPLTIGPGACFTFILADVLGDGMNGDGVGDCTVNGSYCIVANGDTIAQLPETAFTYSHIKQFCTTMGCTNSEATNYSASAKVNDGSCTFPTVQPSFTYVEDAIDCIEATVAFTSTSLYATDFYWEFENGSPSTSTEMNPVVTFASGTTATVKLTASNNSSSEATTQSVPVSFSTVGNQVTLYLEPDCFAEDIAWTITDQNSNVLYSASAGTYKNQYPDNNEVITETFCLPNGCWNFNITDVNANGLEGSLLPYCSTNGNFYFMNQAGDTLAQMAGPNFGSSVTLGFCDNSLLEWTGGTNDSWFELGNWSNGVLPLDVLPYNNVYINAPGETITLTDKVYAHHFTVSAGTTIDLGSEELRLTGDFVNHGNVISGDGKIKFNGVDLQNVKSPNELTLFKVHVDSQDTVRLLTDLNLKGPLQWGGDCGVFDTNGKSLTLQAGDGFQGTIGEIKSGAEILVSTIKFEEYFPAGSGSWRMISIPLNNSTFDQLNDDIPTTGIAGSDFPDYPNSSNPWANIRFYDESFNQGEDAEINVGFTGIQNISDTINSHMGYMVYFIPAPTLIDTEGEINQGTQEISLSFSPSDSTLSRDGWNLIANPFPSTIDWDKTDGTTKVGISNSIYAFDPVTGQYSSYVDGVSIGSLTHKIAPGQAFWVKALEEGAELSFHEKAKNNGMGVSLRSVNPETELTVRMQLSNDEYSDECVFGINQNASFEFDQNLDAYKLYPTNTDLPTIAIIGNQEEQPLCISMMPTPEDGKSIPLEIKTGNLTQMEISNVAVDSFEGGECLTLEDTELDVMVAMNQGDSYAFDVTENTTPNRFVLHLTASLDITVLDETCPESDDAQIIAQGFGEAPWSFTWKDEMGAVVKETSGATYADVMENALPGFYEITVTNNNENCSSAAKVVEVKAGPAMELEAFGHEADCNLENAGSLYIDLAEHYEWDLTIEDLNGEIVKSMSGLGIDTLVSGLQPEIYTVHASNMCGAEIDLGNINLRDANAVQAGMSVNQTTTSLEEGGVIQFSSTSFNADKLVWDFGDGTTDTTSFMPQHAYDTHGTFLATIVALNEFCSDTAKVEITITMGAGPSGNNSGVDALAGLELEEPQDQIQINIGDESIKLEIVTESEEDMHIAVFNMAGQLVIDEKKDNAAAENFSLDISALATGVYTLHVSSSTTLVHSETFVKN